MADRLVAASTAAEFCDGRKFAVIDGCDAVGKTTLAGHLARDMSWQVVHAPYQPDLIDLVDHYRQVLRGASEIAFDRSFTSEVVYGKVLRDYTRIGHDDIAELSELVAARGGTFVHVTTDPDTVVARLNARKESPSDVGLVCAVLEAFDELFGQVSQYAAVLRLDTS